MRLVINRLAHPPSGSLVDEATTSADPRILILSVSPDLAASYIPVMNSIFSAQKLVRGVESHEVFHVTFYPITFRKSPSTSAKYSDRKRCSFSRPHT